MQLVVVLTDSLNDNTVPRECGPMQTRPPILIEEPEVRAPSKDSVEQSEVLTLLGVNQEQWHTAQVHYDRLVSSNRLRINTILVDVGEHRRKVEVIQVVGEREISLL